MCVYTCVHVRIEAFDFREMRSAFPRGATIAHRKFSYAIERPRRWQFYPVSGEFRRRFALINYSLVTRFVRTLISERAAYKRAVANYRVLAAVMQIA